MKNLFPMVLLVVIAALLVWIGMTHPFARGLAAPAPSASMSASASASAEAPSASASVAASAPPMAPYHPGDYKAFLPTGSISIVTEDGGVVRFHDGNEHPCSFGCLSMYSQAMQAESQRTGGKIVDGPAIQREAEACIRGCIDAGGDKFFWPPVEK